MHDRITPATAAEIEIFKAGAYARYAEKGVSPEAAALMFETHMAKTAEALGLVRPAPTPAAVKLASALKAGIASK